MKAIFNILTVSKYEAKTLFRSWFFRIFSMLALIFIFFYNLLSQTSIGFPNGDMVALPSTIPFSNLYIVNVAQAIIAVFLASDFLKRDKKLDTTEVIYMRSMTNADYVIGKTMGNIWVFLLLNIIALGIVAVFNLSSPYTQFMPVSYLYYFLIISFPTLIFILGFSFFLMSIIRNQAVTFVILLGYIAATLFYLQNIYHYLFDYMAFHLPLTFSDFIGFASLKEIIIHRGIYVALGLGFIGLTIMLLKRLPQSNIIRKSTMVSSIVLLLLGFGLALYYITNINIQEKHRKEMLALNDKYADMPVVEIQSSNLELEHNGNRISVRAGLEVVNNNKVPLNEFILTLNPGFKVTELKGAGYVRELQLLRIKPDAPLQPGSSSKLNISYQGNIDESFCYLDITPERIDLLMERGNVLPDMKHAFITPEYLFLTPESHWYPVAGISYSSKGLNWLTVQFTDYSLEVKTNKGLKAISQGKATDDGSGSFEFKPETKLTQISLAIGKYQSRSISVDNITYSLNFLSGHNFFDKYFKNVADSIVPVIRDIKKSWEAKVQSSYPFKRLTLVEIPAQFCSFEHTWNGLNEQAQPETIYLPEGGYKLNSANFAQMDKFSSRQFQHDNETVSPREKEENYFRRFVNDVFLNERSRQFRGSSVNTMMRAAGVNVQVMQSGPVSISQPANPYFIFPDYYDFVSFIKSEKYPITNRVFKSYLSQTATDGGMQFMRNVTGTSSSEKGNIALQDKSFAQILSEQSDPDIIGSVIQTKSGFLFALMKGAVGTNNFDDFLRKFLENKKFREVPISELNDEMRNSFKLDLDQYLPVWYDSKSLPGYIMSKLQAVKIKAEDQMKTMVSFIMTNTEEAPGAVTITFRLGFGGRGGGGGGRGGGGGGGGGMDNSVEKTILIGAKQSKQVSYLLNRDPRMMTIDTYASHNIPSTISQGFEKIETNEKLIGTEDEEIIPYTDGSEPSEIILDNEDQGFKVEQPVTQSLIKKLFLSSDEPEDNLKYKGMNTWSQPVDWTLITNDQFYGKEIRSAYYIKGGNGNCKAIWNLPIKEKGSYKLSVYIDRAGGRDRGGGGGRGQGGGGGGRGPGGGGSVQFTGGSGQRSAGGQNEKIKEEYNYYIYSDDGKDHQAIDLRNIDGGWTDIGSYHFSPGNARVELSNLSKIARSIIIADAVKVVREN